MKLEVNRMAVFLAISLVPVCTPAHAGDDDDPVMMAQLAEAKPVCEKVHAENKQKVKEFEAALLNTSLPPKKKQEVEEKLEKVKAVNAKMDEFLAQPLPAKREDREAYLGQASTFAAATWTYENGIAKDLGLDPKSRMEAVAAKLGSAERFKTKYGDFDWAAKAYNPPEYYAASLQLSSTIPTVQTNAHYEKTSVSDATKINNNDGGLGGGIMLEGSAVGLPNITSVEYNSSVNALLLNGTLVYFVKIPLWSLATMCREIGTDRNELVGVSETMKEGLVFGDKPEIYKRSDLAYDLMLADKFLGDLVFARHKGWTQGYKFPTAQPVGGRFKSEMLVRFAFYNFKFAIGEDGVIANVSSSLEVRFLPVSKMASPTGQMQPDYNALDKGWTPPDAFLANARILTDNNNMDHFRHEPLVENVFSYGETAAILRSLKYSGRNLNALANQILPRSTE